MLNLFIEKEREEKENEDYPILTQTLAEIGPEAFNKWYREKKDADEACEFHKLGSLDGKKPRLDQMRGFHFNDIIQSDNMISLMNSKSSFD